MPCELVLFSVNYGKYSSSGPWKSSFWKLKPEFLVELKVCLQLLLVCFENGGTLEIPL